MVDGIPTPDSLHEGCDVIDGSKYIITIWVRERPWNSILDAKLYNKKQHQSENSECGVYAIYFLIQRLLNFDFKTITNNIITDKQMNDFRSVIFRPR